LRGAATYPERPRFQGRIEDAHRGARGGPAFTRRGAV
jgi:hypothetical protein